MRGLHITPAHCAVCGATGGMPHHDPDISPLIVKLRRSRKRKRLECQLCNDGLNQSRKQYKSEVATVLAALRHFQNTRGGFDHPEWLEHFNEAKPLTDDAIDDLCERINFGEWEVRS